VKSLFNHIIPQTLVSSNWFLGSTWEPISRGSASLWDQENWRQSRPICVTRLCLV